MSHPEFQTPSEPMEIPFSSWEMVDYCDYGRITPQCAEVTVQALVNGVIYWADGTTCHGELGDVDVSTIEIKPVQEW